MKPKPNTDWLAALESAIGSTVDKPGPEWKTRHQLQGDLGLGHTATHRALRKLVEHKRVETRNFTIILNGKRRPTPHYRLK